MSISDGEIPVSIPLDLSQMFQLPAKESLDQAIGNLSLPSVNNPKPIIAGGPGGAYYGGKFLFVLSFTVKFAITINLFQHFILLWQGYCMGT